MEMFSMTNSYRVLLLVAALAATSACGGRENREVPVGKAGETGLAIGSVTKIQGTSLLRATVEPRRTPRGIGSASLSYSDDYLRNFLIIDPRSGTSRRILPDNSRTIADSMWLPDAEATANTENNVDDFDEATSFYVIPLRQSGESRLIDIYTGKVVGGPATSVVTGAQELYSATALGNGRVALLLAKGGRAMHVLVDIDAATVVSETPVPIQ